MYAVDPTASHGKSEVQTASFRWEDPFLLYEQLTEDEAILNIGGVRCGTRYEIEMISRF